MMNGVDTEWCLRCGDSRPQEGDQFCSDACRDLHRADNHPLIIPSCPSSPSLSVLSDHPFPHHHLLYEDAHVPDVTHAEDWAGKGASGVAAWAAAIPLGAPPLSASLKPSSPSKTSPQPIRPRASTSSAASTSSGRPRRSRSKSHPHPTPSSATLRPSLPSSVSTRKPAPPRLFLHSTSPSQHECVPSPGRESSVCSPYTATCTALPHASTSTYDESPALSPVQPILNPRISLPSLTTQSATASLSSLATPHTASRPPSRPQSRPSSRPNSLYPSQQRSSLHLSSCPGSASVSIAGDPDDLDDDDVEKTPESRPAKKSWVHTAVKSLSTRVSEWAGSARHQPYAYGHVMPAQGAYTHSLSRQCSLARVQREFDEPVASTSAAPSREPSRPPSPLPSAPIPRVGVASKGGFCPRAHRASPPPMFPMQDELAGYFVKEERKPRLTEKTSKPASGKQQQQPAQAQDKQQRTLRVGRGLVPASRVQSRVDLPSMWHQPAARKRTAPTYIREEELHAFDEDAEREAFQARGRRAERQERTFAVMQGLEGVVQ